MSIDKETLRATAKTIVTIPQHYHLEMEASIPEGNEQRCFIWEDPENQDNTIEIALDGSLEGKSRSDSVSAAV